MIDVIGVTPVFTALNGVMLFTPAAGRLVAVLLLVHRKVVTPIVLVKTMFCVGVPLQAVCTDGDAVTVGVGFTVMVSFWLKPTHPLAVGVTTIIAYTGTIPGFEATNEGMLVVPDALYPMDVLLLVQA